MRIQSLTIHSYKSFTRTSEICFTPNFNIFIGPNNCGKTNILDAIYFLFHPEEDPQRLHHHRTNLVMRLEFNEREQTEYNLSSHVDITGREYSVTALMRGGDESLQTIRAEFCRRIKRLRYEDFNDIETIERDHSYLARQYPEIYNRFTTIMHEYFPEVASLERIIDIESDLGSAVVQGGKSSITIERLGSGFRRVFVILLYVLHPDFSVVLIDEPEIHLHPGMIKKIRRLLQDAQANQVIATSHSPLFVAASNLHQIFRVLKDADGSHVYYMNRYKHTIDRKRLVQELNSDNIEMFFADKVLLVEGVSDRILMRGLIDRFYTGPDDVKVIYTHGKSNIDIYLDLMRIFHIPFMVMLDRDALHIMAEQFVISVAGHANKGGQTNQILIDELKRHNVYILENGTIEKNYPMRYQTKDTKPLNALLAAANITIDEYNSLLMKDIKEVVDHL